MWKTIEIKQLVTGCAYCTSHMQNGDGYTELKVKGKIRLLTHMMYESTYNVSILKTYVLRHKCDTPQCINPYHLEVGTHADNVADRVSRGRSAVGIKNGRSKLTEGQVREIKTLQGTGVSAYRVGKIYKIDGKVIREIWRGLKWKTVS